MNATGYIGLSVGLAALGAAVLAMASTDDDLQDSLAAAGADVDRTGDTIAVLASLGLFGTAAVLLLIGVIGAGVRLGQRSD